MIERQKDKKTILRQKKRQNTKRQKNDQTEGSYSDV